MARRYGVFGQPPPGVTGVEADHRLPNAQFVAAEAVVALGTMTRIGEGGVDPGQRGGLPHGRAEVGRILARPDARHGAEDQMGVGVDNGGQLRPGPLPVTRPVRPPYAEASADVPRLEAGRPAHRRKAAEAHTAGQRFNRAWGVQSGGLLLPGAPRAALTYLGSECDSLAAVVVRT